MRGREALADVDEESTGSRGQENRTVAEDTAQHGRRENRCRAPLSDIWRKYPPLDRVQERRVQVTMEGAPELRMTRRRLTWIALACLVSVWDYMFAKYRTGLCDQSF